MGHARQLRRRADRLPAARRAARLDRRHPGLLPHRELPVRQRRVPRPAGWPTSPPSSRRTARCRSSYRTCSSTPRPATAAWGDAATIVPWVIYERTGDAALLARQLPSMRAWVDRMAELAGGDLLWSGGFQFGDWLDPTAPPDNPFRAKADPDVIATAHLARSAEVVAQAAELVGDADLAREYADLAARVRQAFASEYTTEGGRVLSDAATNYALALQWALLPTEAQRKRAGERLADLVRTAGFRISTGFVGTPLMADALADSGHPDLAYRLLLADRLPLLAVRSDDGRDDCLGTLGQHAARRQHQPRPDDVVQPLRPRRGRRLDAPPGRRPGRRATRATARSSYARCSPRTSPTRRPSTSPRTARPRCRGRGPTDRSGSASPCRSVRGRWSTYRVKAHRSRSVTARTSGPRTTRPPRRRRCPRMRASGN